MQLARIGGVSGKIVASEVVGDLKKRSSVRVFLRLKRKYINNNRLLTYTLFLVRRHCISGMRERRHSGDPASVWRTARCAISGLLAIFRPVRAWLSQFVLTGRRARKCRSLTLS